MRRSLLSGILLVGALLAAGTSVSAVAAHRRHDEVLADARTAFDAKSVDITGSIGTEVRRATDLLAGTGSYVLTSERITPDEYEHWADLYGHRRQPALLGSGYVVRVPADRLAAYLADRGEFAVVPPGDRPYYCFVENTNGEQVGLSGTAQTGHDRCALEGAEMFIRSAGLNRAIVTATSPSPGKGTDIAGSAFVLTKPFYDGLPGTPRQREAAVRGWTWALLDAPVLLQAAIDAGKLDSLGIDLRWTGPGVPVRAARVEGPDGPVFHARTDFEAEGPWEVRLTGSAAAAHASATRQAWTVFAVGELFTALLAGLFLSLVGSRNRALRLVARRTDELRHQALHDGLTGLPNRVLALDRAEQLLARCRRERTVPAALFLDLDGFKAINDSFGHGAGDDLLRAVAARLRSTVRESETVARLGGDEFVILAECGPTGMGAELLAQRILDVMAEPFRLSQAGDTPFTISLSVGLAVGDRPEPGELLRDADVAVYQAKASGKNCYVLFQPEMQTIVQDRLQLEMDLHGAIDRGTELFLQYQPTFGLEHGEVTGVEALLRWNHPTRGLVSPAEIIPLAEDTGLILPIGRWVLHEACRQGASWHAAGFGVSMAVNVSGRQLESDDVVDVVAGALAATGFDPASLILEITETTIMEDADATAARLGRLKGLGVRIAIDDFGTGYSSLAYLQRFPVDTLKIDRSFVAAMAQSEESEALVHTLVQLGKTLGLETVAEGIEHAGQLDQLQGEDCDSGQGFLFAKPLDADDASAFFAEHSVRSPVAR